MPRRARREAGEMGSNGKEEARESLARAIELILQDRREDALRGLPADAEQETVTVG